MQCIFAQNWLHLRRFLLKKKENIMGVSHNYSIRCPQPARDQKEISQWRWWGALEAPRSLGTVVLTVGAPRRLTRETCMERRHEEFRGVSRPGWEAGRGSAGFAAACGLWPNAFWRRNEAHPPSGHYMIKYLYYINTRLELLHCLSCFL